MIREDRELLAGLARLNTDMVSLAMRIMDDSASADEQARYAQRLITAGDRLQRRAEETAGTVIEGEVLANGLLTTSEDSADSAPCRSGPGGSGLGGLNARCPGRWISS